MIEERPSRPRWQVDAVLVLALFVSIVLLSTLAGVKELNRRVTDGYYRLQKATHASEVVVVAIDDASLQREGRWPWSRSVLARLVREVAAANPRVIGIDILLTEAQSEAADADLRDAIERSHRVVLVDKIGSFPDGPSWMEPLPAFERAALRIGHAQAILDADGICRSFPPEELSLAGPRYAFAIEVARYVEPAKTSAFLARHEFHFADDGQSVLTAKPTLIPIPFQEGGIASISAADVLSGKNLDRLRGKIVLIGFGPVEIGDRITTPISRDLPTPGVEIHAQIADGIVSGRMIRNVGPRAHLLLLFLVCAIALQAFRQWRGWKTIPGLIVFGALTYIGGAATFHVYGWIVPAGEVLVVGVLAPLLIYGVEFAAVERSISSQMRLLQEWLPYRDEGTEPPTDLSWRIKVLKNLQQELGLRFELYRSLIEATRDLVAVFDADGTLLFSNMAFMNAWRLRIPKTLREARSYLIESQDAPLVQSGPVEEGEVTLHGALYSLRIVPLPATSVTPNGGMLMSMTSLHLREELDHARSEALGFVTHELRTPLVAIQGFAEMMTRYPDSTATEHAPATILRESKRLLALINSYLDVLRTDAGARPLRIETIQVGRMVRQVLDLLTPIAQASSIRLLVSGDDSLTVQGDEALLTGAVLNLVSNAIKYGNSDNDVRVALSQEEGELWIEVHNFGQPIAEADPQSVFGTFVRGKRHESKTGWGLGLSFVKRIIIKHGGRVWVTSSLEEGTTFRLCLPAAKAAVGASSR